MPLHLTYTQLEKKSILPSHSIRMETSLHHTHSGRMETSFHHTHSFENKCPYVYIAINTCPVTLFRSVCNCHRFPSLTFFWLMNAVLVMMMGTIRMSNINRCCSEWWNLYDGWLQHPASWVSKAEHLSEYCRFHVHEWRVCWCSRRSW
jgi:hypothetical protein